MSMKKTTFALMVALCLAASLTPAIATAHTNIALGFNLGGVFAPPVVAYPPPVVNYAPPVVYYAPPVVNYAPPVVYYGAPRVIYPSASFVITNRGWGHGGYYRSGYYRPVHGGWYGGHRGHWRH